MVVKKAIIRNSRGIHARPSGYIVNEVQGYDGRIKIYANNEEADIKSVLEILAMGLKEGDEIEIRVSGPEEESTAQRVADLFENRFDFPPRQ